MADQQGDRDRDRASDGSDIEVEREEEEVERDNEAEDFIEPFDAVDRAEMDAFVRAFLETDDEDEEFAGFQYRWVFDNFERRTTRPFTRARGMPRAARQKIPNNPRAVDFFLLFWDDAVWDRMIYQSNLYAQQQRRANPPPQSFASFTEFSKAELKTFIGLCLMMGVIRLPKRSDYWRTKKTCWLAHTNFGKAMSRDRYNCIWRYLHLEDNTAPSGGDKLFKLREFLNSLLKNFKTSFQPGATMAVDESMIKFKGRLGFRQYMPMKPIKWGVKVWALAESSSGYILNFQVYTGRDNNVAEHGLSHRVVMDMCRMLEATQAQVYFDNFFTSVKLMDDLRHLEVQACGTVRAARKDLPKDILPKKGRPALPRHQSKLAQRDDLCFAHWQDTKPVCVLSNFHDPKKTGTVKRRVDGQRQDVVVPACLADYQKNMKGVDLCDQMVGYYLLNHRSWKWWRRIFFHMMLVSVHNAYVVAKSLDRARAKKDWPEFQDFVEAVAHELVTTTIRRQAPAQEGPLRPNLDHTIDKIFLKRKTCATCSRLTEPGERRPTTNFGCVQCKEACHPKCLGDHIRHHHGVSAREVEANSDTDDDSDTDDEAEPEDLVR